MWVLEGAYLGSHARPSFHKQEIEVPGRKTACSHVIYMSTASPFRSGLISMGPDVLSPPDTMHSFIPLGEHLLGPPTPTPPTSSPWQVRAARTQLGLSPGGGVWAHPENRTTAS